MKTKEDLNNLQDGDECDVEDGCLTKATQDKDHNFAHYRYQLSDGHSVNIYDGYLDRFVVYQRLYHKMLNCSFKIKVRNNYETVNSFYLILKCNDIENDVEKETNFSVNFSNKIEMITFVIIYRDKSATNNHCFYFRTSDERCYSLFLNNQNEHKKLEKIGIHLKEYWPIDDEFEQKLIKSIKDRPLIVHYNERERGNNITCIEYIDDEIKD